MSRLVVDTDRLTERCLSGSRICGKMLDDAEKLTRDAAALCDILRDNEEDGKAEEIMSAVSEVSGLIGSIAMVSEYDRFAIKRYLALLSKIDSLVSSAGR